jgi:hypothetical protein
MATITTPPWSPGARPATIPGSFSGGRHLVTGAPHFGGPSPAGAGDCRTQFLAPPTTEREKPAPRASDSGEVAMHRLRHPFAVAAESIPHRVTKETAAYAV